MITFRLFLLFTIVPVLELFLLLEIGERIGAAPTIALVIASGLLGAALAKREGLRVVRRWQVALAERRLPEEGVLSGLLVLVGGVLLVTPGVVTDAVGLALLVPTSRRFVAARLRRRLERRFLGRVRPPIPRRASDTTVETRPLEGDGDERP